MRAALPVLAAACLFTLYFGLDTVGYLDVREARDALVAEEIHSAGEWLTPVLGHEALFDKPIAGYLPELLTHDPVSESPLASRLLRAALATALVVLTGWMGAAHFGRRAGFAAAFVISSTLALPFAARTDAAQLLGTIAAWAALAGFARALFAAGSPHAPGSGATIVRSHVALAAACLFAGPLPALWPIAGVVLYARLSNRPESLRAVRPLAALAVIAGFALPWYGAMAERHGVAFLSRAGFFPYGANTAGPWYAGGMLTVSLLVAGTFPWSVMLPAAFAHSAIRWRRSEGDEREERSSHFFIACLVAALIPIAFYPTPPITAALAAAPAVALLCGRFIDHLLEDPARLRGVFVRSNLMLGFTATVIAIAFSAAGTRLAPLFPALRWVAPFALLSGWAPFLAHYFLLRTRAAVVLFALPVVVGTPLVAFKLLPELEDFLSARRSAEAMNAVAPPRAPLVLLDEAPPSLRLYLARNTVRLDSLAALARWGGGDGYAYLAFFPSTEKETARRLGTPLEVLARTPALVLARTPVAAAKGAATVP